jgi:hypothetical protein
MDLINKAAGILIERKCCKKNVFKVWESQDGLGAKYIEGRISHFRWIFWGSLNNTDNLFRFTNDDFLALFRDEKTAQKLSGVFALFVENIDNGDLVVVIDRLGVQAIFYTIDHFGDLNISTHLAWLLVSINHSGEINPEGLFCHLGFGYSVIANQQVYKDVKKLPSAGYMKVINKDISVKSYWSDKDCHKSDISQTDIQSLSDYLHDSIIGDIEQPVLGLTSGKDSLCLASSVHNCENLVTVSLGHEGCADKLQASEICSLLGWQNKPISLVFSEDFERWANFISFHSAGLATLSYVDMCKMFLEVSISIPDSILIMGEGGECIRDFFNKDPFNAPLTFLSNEYITPSQFIYSICRDNILPDKQQYQEELLSIAGQELGQLSELDFVKAFYRKIRMPGNFSLRNTVLSPIFSRRSPFLGSYFINQTFGLGKRWYEKSSLHRAIIEKVSPNLLVFFDSPIKSPISTQDWNTRFANGLERIIINLLKETLPYCEKYFNLPLFWNFLDSEGFSSQRIVYFLLRLLSFSLFQRKLHTDLDREFSTHVVVLQTNE